MGTWITECQSPIFEFPSRKAITRVQTSPNVDTSRNSNGHISVLRDTAVTWLGTPVVPHILCMLMWPWPDPRSRSVQGHGAFELPRIAHNCTFLGLSRISSTTFAWSSKRMVAGDSLGHGLQLVGARFSNFRLGKLSREFKCRGMLICSKFNWPYFGSAWGYSQIGWTRWYYYRYCACWYNLDPIQGQG